MVNFQLNNKILKAQNKKYNSLQMLFQSYETILHFTIDSQKLNSISDRKQNKIEK